MAFFLLSSENRHLKWFPYLGISKKTWFMCNVFLKALKFETRGSHGQLHPLWTLPRVATVGESNAFASGIALKAVKQRLADILCRPPGTFQPYRPESTTVRSSRLPSIHSGAVSVVDSELSSRLALAHIHNQRAGVAGSRTPINVPPVTQASSRDNVDENEDRSSGKLDSTSNVDYWSLRAQYISLIRSLRVSRKSLPTLLER